MKAYMRNGHGSSYGVGVKFDQVRADYNVDHNTMRGSFLFILEKDSESCS